MSNYYEKIKKGFTGAVNVAAAAARQAAEVAKDLAEDLTSFKALKDYKLAGHVATAGPGGNWKIFNAVNKKPGAVFPEASVWILDKKRLVDQASRAGRARGFDTFFEQQRRSCTQMLRLKHPGVIKVIEPLEETNTQMLFVTEPVFGSLANALSHFTDVPTAPADRAGVHLSPLESKYGLCSLAETLHFLHHEAKLVHCNLNPGSIVIARDGGWKLTGFEFVSSINEFGGSAAAAAGAQLMFEYTSTHPSPWEEFAQPPLAYTAPELVGGSLASSDVTLSGAADCFSLAALTYQLVTGKQLLPVGSSTGEYRSRLSNASCWDMSGVAAPLQPLLRAMLSNTPAARPNAAAFSGCQWFQEDMLLRCLKFLDTIIQRESSQKVGFLKDLMTFWHQFDDRLLQHRVLPPIVQEMRNEMVALAALPVVLAIMGRMRPEGFAASGILPVLKPIFEHADGEVLLALVRHLAVFYNLMTSDAHGTVLVPLMLRAFDSSNTRAQEETLKALQRLAPDMSYSLLRESLMPRVVGLCLRTTSLVVRVSALALMTQAAHRLDKEAAGAMLDVCGQIVAVDRSAGTAMAVLRLGDAIGKHYGPDLTAAKVLPLLCPLLMSPGLNNQQFQAYVTTVRSLLDKVAEKRGGELAAAAEAAGTATAASAAAAAGAGVGLGLGGSGGSGSAGDLMNDAALFGGAGGGSGAGRSPVAAAAGGGSVHTGTGWGGVSGAASSTSSMATTWDAPMAPSSSSAATTPAAAAAGGGASWSSAAWTSSSTGHLGGSSSSSIGGMSSWNNMTPPQQQQQQQQRMSGGSGAGSIGLGMPVPDIFSSTTTTTTTTDMLAGLGLGSQTSVPHGASSNGPAASGGMDLFGGLAVSGGNNSMQQQQQQQQPRSPMALKPPPAAKSTVSVLAGSSSSHDPFAGLALGGSSSSSQPTSSPAFDPFSSLAAGAPAAGSSSTTDMFAGLTSSVGSSGASMAAQRQQQQQQRPLQQQQQQQQWSGGVGGSLI